MNKSLCVLHLVCRYRTKAVINARMNCVMAAQYYFWEKYAVPARYPIMNKTGLGMQIIDSAGAPAILRRQRMTTQ